MAHQVSDSRRLVIKTLEVFLYAARGPPVKNKTDWGGSLLPGILGVRSLVV
jgi:hypothetical protein